MTPKPQFSRLGKYTIESTIGQGAMGVVYKGYDANIDRHVAIKVLHPHLIAHDVQNDLLIRFKQEVQAAARCHHANIVTVFDYGESDGIPYMVMEFVEGIDLKSFIKQGIKVSIKQVGDIILQVLDALDYSHKSGVVHRDIKPANVMLLDNGRVKVTDFGVAKIDTSDLTNIGDVIGTPTYMSPEALRGETVDGRSDLYAVALVLLELLCGRRPTSSDAEWNRTLVDSYLAESSILPSSQMVAFSEMLIKALKSDPSERFQSAQAFSDQLKQAVVPGAVYVSSPDELAATVIQSKVTRANRRHDAATGPETTSGLSQIQLSPEQSTLLSRTLAPYLGPVSSHLIRNLASSCNSLEEIIQKLSSQIPNADERRKFLRSLETSGIRFSGESSGARTGVFGSSASGSVPVAAPPTVAARPLTVEELNRATQHLAPHIGPLASRLVKMAAAKASSLDELYRMLAERIPDERERAKFLANRRSTF